jgi:Protein of unknown function (DUF3435)
MNSDDLYLLHHFHWINCTSVFPQERQRIQFSCTTLIEAGTATRLGAVLAVPINHDKLLREYISYDEGADFENYKEDVMPPNEDYGISLLYEDVEIIMLPNPGAERDILLMKVDLTRVKGSARSKQP